jgi:hypothetical protein
MSIPLGQLRWLTPAAKPAESAGIFEVSRIRWRSLRSVGEPRIRRFAAYAVSEARGPVAPR